MNRKLTTGEMGRKTVEEFRSAGKTPLVFVLDNVRSAHNTGSVFRTADAFLLHELVLCGYTATPPHRDLLKTALGATETVHWRHFEHTTEAVTQLTQEGWTVLAAEQTEQSTALDTWQPAPGQKLAIVFGNEVEGVQQQVIDFCAGTLEIPQHGAKHSLNIAVCAGIMAWELSRKLKS
ncbi:MAG: RNA methyltransferase [Bacteroidia bacterium]|jgi:tRNA G18 (ribose-2'-O)-methylase SpoU|nr:RNA methyltransferase [Bacteroidia bacterium]